MKEYPDINREKPKELLYDYMESNNVNQVLKMRAIYKFDDSFYITIKPDYENVEDDINHDSVRWFVLGGPTQECGDTENGPFETVSDAVEFIKDSYL